MGLSEKWKSHLLTKLNKDAPETFFRRRLDDYDDLIAAMIRGLRTDRWSCFELSIEARDGREVAIRVGGKAPHFPGTPATSRTFSPGMCGFQGRPRDGPRAAILRMVSGAPAMPTLCQTFRKEAGVVWNRIRTATRLGLALSEETLTECSHIALAHQAQISWSIWRQNRQKGITVQIGNGGSSTLITQMTQHI
jgi:hypothetical protein